MDRLRTDNDGNSGRSTCWGQDCAPSAPDVEVLASLAVLAVEATPSAEVLADAVERVVSVLGLSGATLSLLSDRDGVSYLQAVASAGAHAAFARDMSARPLDSLTDVATAISENRPLFIEDVHGMATGPEEEDGVGRWRAGVSGHGTAVLPVRAWGETLGVLTIEWPGTRPFGGEERRILQAVAALVSLIVDKVRRAQEKAPASAEERRAPITSSCFGVTENGIVVPFTDDQHGIDSVLRISMASRAGAADDAPLWEVAGVGRGSAVLMNGVATVPGGDARLLAGECARTLRIFTSQGAGPADSLRYLGHTVRASGPPGSRVSAAVCSIDVSASTAVLTFATAGSVLTATLTHQRRLTLTSAHYPALSSASALEPDDEHALLLPGDRIAFACGQFASLVTDEGCTSVLDALGGIGCPDDTAAVALLELLGDAGRAGSVVLIERATDRRAMAESANESGAGT